MLNNTPANHSLYLLTTCLFLQCIDSFFHSTSQTIEQQALESSNFLDTLVFDALCSRLVAHNARLFRHFFWLIISRWNFSCKKNFDIFRDRTERKVIAVHNYCFIFEIIINNNIQIILNVQQPSTFSRVNSDAKYYLVNVSFKGV